MEGIFSLMFCALFRSVILKLKHAMFSNLFVLYIHIIGHLLDVDGMLLHCTVAASTIKLVYGPSSLSALSVKGRASQLLPTLPPFPLQTWSPHRCDRKPVDMKSRR